MLADRFLNWAMKNRIAPSGQKVPPHRRGTSKKLSVTDQDTALSEVVDGESLTTRDKARPFWFWSSVSSSSTSCP
jgi:hypothetical protein